GGGRVRGGRGAGFGGDGAEFVNRCGIHCSGVPADGAEGGCCFLSSRRVWRPAAPMIAHAQWVCRFDAGCGELTGRAVAGRPFCSMSPGLRCAAASSFTYAKRPPGHDGARLRNGEEKKPDDPASRKATKPPLRFQTRCPKGLLA